MTKTQVTTAAANAADAAESLRQQFAQARASGKRAKEAAAAIGVSEGAAVAAHLGIHAHPPKAQLLRADWVPLLQALEAAGPLLALTRNESTVHEKTGVYHKVSGGAAMGMALGEAIDLRLFFSRWRAAFAVTELAANPGNRPNRSIQIFDTTGLAIHKIFPREASDWVAWNAAIDGFVVADAPAPVFDAPVSKPALKPDAEIDAGLLGAAWADMKDTHEFFGLLHKHGAERQQALRLMQGRFTQALPREAVRATLMDASFSGTPIMCFVGNPGCIQIHSGPVSRIEPMDIRGVSWLNVLDADFNLHLREDSIAHVWAVEKPTSDGVVTSVEAFDHAGELMAMFFGARKPGKPELVAWRELVRGLPRLALDEVAA
jgi:putative hemin transport protein